MTTRTGSLSDIAITTPHNFDALRPPANERQIGRFTGITQFGVNHLTLAPGARSARRHWHEEEDEFAYVLSGRVVLVDEAGAHELVAGSFAGFVAGEPNAHHIQNRSSEPAELLIVGTRKRGEERIHYPDESQPGSFSIFRDEHGNSKA